VLKRVKATALQMVRKVANAAGIEIRRLRTSREPTALETLQVLQCLRHHSVDLPEFRFLEFASSVMNHSTSQSLQDAFMLFERTAETPGYFVEFGAGDGVALSNTYMLEKHYGWTGILAEPARRWQQELPENRSCSICLDCVWHKTGETLIFNETSNADHSTIDLFTDVDYHRERRADGVRYPVTTVSLTDLLARFDAPDVIDYLSIDTEGSELVILQAFDFERYDVRCITVEHNYTPQRTALAELLARKGFVRKFQSLSGADDWYVKSGAKAR
jgi:FkbM family methyltransferase